MSPDVLWEKELQVAVEVAEKTLRARHTWTAQPCN